MSTLTHCEQPKARARHRSWSTEIDSEPMFKRVVTLDPGYTIEAWENLSVNTAMLEFQELPVRLHHSLSKEIKAWIKKLAE